MKKIHSLFLLIVLVFCSCNKSKIVSPADVLYDNGYDLYFKKNYDSAFISFYKASQEYINNRDNHNLTKTLIFLAIIQTEKGDFLGSNESLEKATKFIQPNDKDNFVSIYNQFAINHNSLKNYKEAIYCYNKALSYSADHYSNLNIENNIGVSNLKIKNYSEALKVFRNISNDPTIKDSIDFRNRVYDNLAFTKFLFNQKYNVENELTSVLDNRIKRNDIYGINASVSHLADYFQNSDQKKSLYYAKFMYENAKKTGSSSDQLDALKKMIKVEDSRNIKILFDKYQSLNDSIQNITNRSKNLFTSVIYEAEQSRTEALSSKNKIQKQYFLLGLSILIIIITITWYRKRQASLKQENELKIKENKLKMSKKIHDVVANGIYQVMTKIENQEDFDRDKALDELEFVYEKSRDISYDKIREEKEFSKVISELIASFNSETVKTFTAGNSTVIWEPISATVKEEVYQMIRELMVNMKKHSHASHVAVKFEKINNLIEIQYKDNGIGISGDLIYKNGLRNTASRIEAINGTITFDTKIEKGLKVNLSFPVS